MSEEREGQGEKQKKKKRRGGKEKEKGERMADPLHWFLKPLVGSSPNTVTPNWRQWESVARHFSGLLLKNYFLKGPSPPPYPTGNFEARIFKNYRVN